MAEEQLTMIQDEAERKPRKKKKRRKKHYFLRLLGFVALCFAAYLFANSEYFDLQHIEVVNNSYYTPEQIVALSGATQGENIFRLSLRDMRDSLLRDNYIKSASLKRKLPSTLEISVEERHESAAVKYGGEYVLIDLDGMVLRRSNIEPGVPVLEGPIIKNMEAGTPIEVEETAIFTDTLQMVGVMNENAMYFKKIDISSVIVKAYIYDNLIVQGTPENLSASMESKNLQAVVYDLYEKGTERGTISVGSESYISFSPAMS